MKSNSRQPGEPGLPVWSLSLGCPKNRVDSERLLGSLGLPVVPVERIDQSRLVFINTCGFIESAVRESIHSILEAAEVAARARRPPLLAVAGCMVGRYGLRDLSRELPEVDIWLPTGEMPRWGEILRQALGLEAPAAPPTRLLSTGPAYAWLKIGEGCRHKCSFCTIPAIRGLPCSTPASSLLDEAAHLLDAGVRELVLVAQDLTDWGRDLAPAGGGEIWHLPRLLEGLLGLPGLAWLRLLYLYPSGISPDLLDFLRQADARLLRYLDIPLQHSETALLRSMGRPFARDPRQVLEMIRSRLPGAVLRTSLIVGYPGESDAHFSALCDFVRDARFQHLGVFAFEAEEGTKAATLPSQVPKKVREERRLELMSIQAGISRAFLAEQVGRRLPVLVEEERGDWPGLHQGRVWFQAPEIDGICYVSGPGVRPGHLVECDIVESADYDLTALA